MLYKSDKGVNVAACPPEGGPVKAWGFLASSLSGMACLSMLQLTHLKVAQPKPGAFQPQVCHGALTVWHEAVACQASSPGGNLSESKIELVLMKEEEFIVVLVGHHNI